MSSVVLAIRYAGFAAVSAAINLATQWLSFHFYRGPGELMFGIAAGTGTGLVSKYVLDKFWIFDDRSAGLIHNMQKFSYYTLTGVITTAMFWGTETGFALGGNQAMRYVGAVVGLSIGYFLKYQLDRRFVFRATP
jgi:putative flippase GtrA